MEWIGVVCALALVPWGQVVFSSVVTCVHTAEEVDGEIWRFLHVPAPAYFLFQTAVLCLGATAGVTVAVAVVLIIIRVVDVIGTHLILQAPGRYTAGLLIVDAAVLFCCYT